jgi:hypothetical protein
LNTLELIQSILQIIKRNLLWIILGGVVVAIYPTIRTLSKKTLYKSYSKIFPLQAENADPMSGVKASFGLGSESDLSKYYNVNELINSRQISRQIVNYPTGNSNYPKLYDWLLADYNSTVQWPGKKIDIASLKDSIEKIEEASKIFIGATEVKQEKTEFTSIFCTSTDKTLSLLMNKCALDGLSDFYINSKTAKARKDVDNIASLLDSLKGVIYEIDRAQLGFADNTKYIVKEIATLSQVRLERMKAEAEAQYEKTGEAYQNANFQLLSAKPIFQILDYPTTPLETIKDSKVKSFAIFFIIGAVLTTLFVLRKMIINLALAALK